MLAHSGFLVRSHPDCLFAGLAGCLDLLHGPHDFLESKIGGLGDGAVPNDYAVAATSTRTKAG
jgi:hypothetical protein